MSEAESFGRYVVGVPPSPVLARRYSRAVESLAPLQVHTHVDRQLLEVCRAWPWTLGPLDTATALLRPHSPLRKRLLVMGAILEAAPDHLDRLLPSGRTASGDLMRMFLRVSLEAPRLLLGSVLLALIGIGSLPRRGSPDRERFR